ncbi:MAG: o-succinylbenzoate synthase [Chlamydiae bacterium]|nr:o-succinylbenzoate synthase [Chlamydiota bacterium]
MIIKDCIFETILIDSRCFRKGILLHLTNQEGKSTTTEISPLPGFSKETLEEALQQLKKIKQRLVTTWWTKSALHYLSNLGLYPSVYFAVETALLDLLTPLETPIPCQKYALLFGCPSEIFERAEEISSEDFKHAKIKLGHFTPETAHQIVAKLGDQFRLRIDLNRKWDFEETMRFCAHYPKDFFEYIEEPSTSVEDLLHFPYPYALDETLREIKDLTPYLQSKNLKAFILKPTMTYPITPYLNLGPEIVLTSSFESPIGIAQIERLIQRCGLEEIKHGLDTLRYFEYETMSDCALEKTSP